GLLPLAGGGRTVWQSRHSRLDRHGGRRDLPGAHLRQLASLAPDTGGPYAYTRIAYGDFAGFLIAWGYWISIWTSLPVIAIAFAGAVMDLAPDRLLNKP